MMQSDNSLGLSPSTFNRMARALVFSRLNAMHSASLDIRDPFGHKRLGRGKEAIAIDVRDAQLWRKVMTGGLLSAFESYIDGGWDTDDLLPLLRSFLRDVSTLSRMNEGCARVKDWARRLRLLARRNTKNNSRRNISAHYDLSNEFFAAWLDETMTYSAGIWTRADDDLATASRTKLDRICQKLGLQPGMTVLEIGTGWGSFALHAAENYGVKIQTTTISKEQAALARTRFQESFARDRIELLEVDYRDLRGQFDRLVSIEMIEAVGHEFLPRFLRTCADRLKPNGLAAIQAITVSDARYERMRHSEDFIKRYIFPGSCLLSMRRTLNVLARHTDLSLFGHEDLSEDYGRTLAAWRHSFRAADERVAALGFDERFRRIWDLYLAYCEAGFRERFLGSVQFLLAKPEYRDLSYRSPLEQRAPQLATA